MSMLPPFPTPSSPFGGGGITDSLAMIVYGHSFTVNGGFAAVTPGVPTPAGTPATESWVARAAARLGMPLVNRGVAGTMMRDVYQNIVTTTPWQVGTNGLVMVEGVLNDVRFGGLAALQQVGYQNALNSALSLLCAGAIKGEADASIAYVGAWGGAASPLAVGGTVNGSDTLNDQMTITFAGDEITVLILATDSTIAGGAATITITIDGNPQANSPFNLNSQMLPDTGSMNTLHATPVPFRYSGLGAGAHTLVMKKTDPTGSSWYMAGYVTPAAQPPVIVVAQDPDIGAASWALDAPYNQGSSAALAVFNGLAQTIVNARNGVNNANLHIANLGTGYSTACNCTGDNIHPNDLGSDVICANYDAIVRALPMVHGLGVGIA